MKNHESLFKYGGAGITCKSCGTRNPIIDGEKPLYCRKCGGQLGTK